MEQYIHSEAVVALGKKIVDELGLETTTDTLARWMAHHIAELIQGIEASTDQERDKKSEELRNAILALWEQRYCLPPQGRPFADSEAVFRAIESLDPERETFRYFSRARAPEDESEEAEECKNWIEIAKGIDFSSKLLINYCLSAAAEASLDKSKEWVELAKDAGFDNTFEIRIVELVGKRLNLELSEEQKITEEQRRVLEDRSKRLKAFLDMAHRFSSDIDNKLSFLDKPSAPLDEPL